MSSDAYDLRQIGLTLENDGGFYKAYTGCNSDDAASYRIIIRNHCSDLRLKVTNLDDREQLRRYFHRRYEKPAPTIGVRNIETLYFMGDEPKATAATNPADNVGTTLIQENIMSNPAIITVATRTFINDQPVESFTKPALYDLIAKQEEAIRTLDKIETKPKALRKEIEDRKAGITLLVGYLDSLPE